MLTKGSDASRSPRKAQIAALVGDDAARLVYQSTRWLRFGALGVIGAIVLILGEAISKQPGLWLGVGVGALVVGVPGLALDRQAGQAASRHLSTRLQRPVRVKSGGIRIAVWQNEVDRVMTG